MPGPEFAPLQELHLGSPSISVEFHDVLSLNVMTGEVLGVPMVDAVMGDVLFRCGRQLDVNGIGIAVRQSPWFMALLT